MAGGAVNVTESDRSVLELQRQEMLVYWQRGPRLSSPASADTSLPDNDNDDQQA